MKRVRLTMSQALVQFLDNQYIECDGVESKFVSGIFGIFAGSKGFSLLWPYALMQAGMNANKSEDALAGSYGMFFLSCAFWLAAMFLLAWGLLRKRDVKA